MHVIVIGAGTGGMCLAHGLRRAGVSVAVYERDRTRADNLYGYRVGIDSTGNRALRACLPPDLFDTFVATCARAPRFFNVLTEKRGTTASFPLRPDDDPVNSERSVSRMTLRQILLTGMEDVVRFGKEFTRYESNADGTVTAHFADGTSATGDLLVAADGTGSRVRRQYLPHAAIEDSGIVAISAKVPVTEETRALLTPEMFHGISSVFAPGGLFCIWHVMEFKWDRDGGLKHEVGGNERELIERWPGLLYDNTRDYINWGLSAAARRFPAGVMDLGGEELIEVALGMTGSWHPDLRRLFALAEPETCFPVSIRTSVPVEPWRSTNVTLLGDAIHTMTPGQGVGANTALRDAMLLCRELAKGGPVVEAVAAYEREMIPYGFARVQDSLARMDGDAAIHKPVIGRAVLAMTRAYFGVTDRVPALKRKFLDDMYAYRGAEEHAVDNS
ncbi:NAD(P)-binding protein [Nonomuraea sp. PA05]|uniref:FAD-dependent oxidoreductase n=1 Tax=Nonomuraea sp. PA05 TaxID=2604466 RepID=UPI0011DB8EED|nr:FAD-dependent monooxygenase [Nonomuraea sp. PA05]TYB64333.1 NAD(P)-binding protein [Nonomuraea sp. PA05]